MGDMLQSLFWQEVPVLASAAAQRLALPTQRNGSSTMFSLSGKSAGILFFSDVLSDPTQHHGLLWQIENGSAGTLTLSTVSQLNQPLSAMELAFDVQLFPSIAMLRSLRDHGGITVAGLLSTGFLFFHEMSLQPAAAASSMEAMQFYDLSAQLRSHGSPTALACVGGMLMIGCSDGAVLGMPHAARSDANPVFELQASSWGINKLISGVFYRTQPPSVVAILHMPTDAHASAKSVALVVYDDCMLRGFNLNKHQEIFSETLTSKAVTSTQQQLHHDGGTSTSKRMVLTFAALCCSASEHMPASEHVLVASFESGSAGNKHHSVFTLIPSAGSRLTIQDRHELSGLSPAAIIMSACMEKDTIWVLVRDHGSTQIMGFSRTGQLAKVALTQEQRHSLVFDNAAQGDAVMLELWEDALSTYQSDEFNAETQILAHVLSPSGLCRFALRDAMAYHGAQLTLSEVEACSLETLCVYIRSAVQTLQRRSPNVTVCQSWVSFLGSYREAWTRRHSALAMYMHGASKRPVCVRGGGMLTVLRSCQAAEVLWISGNNRGGDSGAAVAAWQQIQPALLQDPDMRAIHACVKSTAASLGCLCLDAFVGLLASGVRCGKELATKLATMWLNGPPSGTGRAHDDMARGQHSRWRQQRRLLLLQLGAQLGGVHDPVGALQQYCSHLGLAQQLEATGAGSHAFAQPRAQAAGDGPWMVALVAAAEQQAYSQCCNLRDCLLLLGVMRQLSTIGAVSLDMSQLARLEASLSPALQALLQRTALSYHLASTPASSSSTQGTQVEPALSALEHLTLGASSSAPNRQQQHEQQQQRSQVACAHIALAAKLALALPSLGLDASNTGTLSQPQHLEAAAERLVMWLQQGPKNTGRLLPQDTTSASSASWILQLGFYLIMQREHQALLPLSRLAAASEAQDGSSDLMRGLSITFRLEASGIGAEELTSARKAALVEEAVGCFFRAVSSLAAARRQILPSIVQALRQIVTGLDDLPSPSGAEPMHSSPNEAEPQAMVHLHFYELIMMLFERECAPEGAIMFARAALQQLALLSSPSHQQPLGQSTDLQVLEGRLWSNIFSYSCDLGNFEEAYAAVVANPLPDRALDCLRRLVHELCERNQLLVLCSLPFAGTLVTAGAEGSSQVIPLIQEVVAALQRRACNSDLLMRPQPYRILHDLLIVRSDFRGAARAMLALARRLRGEAPPGAAADALAAYEAAINALSLLKDTDAWLDLTDPWLLMHTSPIRPAPLLFGPSSSDHSGRTGPSEAPTGQEPVLTLQELRREYLLLRCAVNAAQRLPGMDALQQWSGEDEVFSQLLLGGEVEAAISLAYAAFSGAELSSAIERALASVASHCARLQVHEEAELASRSHEVLPGLADWHQRERLMGASQLGSRAAPHWLQLCELLQRYEGVRTPEGLRLHGGCLRVAVADAILKVDRRLCLPPWLLSMFQEEPYAGEASLWPSQGPDFSLLGVYLSHDRLADAVAMVLSRINEWSRTDPRLRQHHAAVWLPHQQIGRLRARLVSGLERGTEQTGLLLQQLDAAVQAHLELAAHDSDVDAAGLDPGNRGAGLQALAATPSGQGTWPPFGSASQDSFGFGHSLGALTPPPPSLLWLPPPVESVGN